MALVRSRLVDRGSACRTAGENGGADALDVVDIKAISTGEAGSVPPHLLDAHQHEWKVKLPLDVPDASLGRLSQERELVLMSRRTMIARASPIRCAHGE